jgi:thioredoxin 1
MSVRNSARCGQARDAFLTGAGVGFKVENWGESAIIAPCQNEICPGWYCVNKGNIPLWIAGAVLLYIGWIAFDMLRPVSGGGMGHTTSISAVRTAKVPVLVEFYADWCGPCKVVGPMVEELAQELKGKAVVIRINVDEDPKLARDHGVGPIPTFIAFKSGREIGRQIGGIPKAQMRQMLGL